MYTHQALVSKEDGIEKLVFQINNENPIPEFDKLKNEWEKRGYSFRANTIYTDSDVFVDPIVVEDVDSVKGKQKKAVGKKSPSKGKKEVLKYEVKGEKLTIKEIAAKYKINQATVRARVLSGKSGDEIVVAKAKRKQPNVYFLDGKEYTIKELAAKAFVSVAGMRARLAKHENNVKLAVAEQSETRGKKGKTYKVEGVVLTIGEIAKKYNINQATIRARIQRGWDGDKLVKGRSAKG